MSAGISYGRIGPRSLDQELPNPFGSTCRDLESRVDENGEVLARKRSANCRDADRDRRVRRDLRQSVDLRRSGDHHGLARRNG